ncbi:hypothetical protein [Actinomadura macra]|uniref:hypothetical protein n=1 Tax=Actinomadura macra TaxID=46164 RepID=UPI0009FDBE20|nr:hypothetical protein [Actinomadura macra]
MRRQTLAVLALVPMLALGLLGCGDDGGKAGASGTAKAASDQEKLRKFAQCMRANGVDMEDPSADGKITAKMSAQPGSGKGAPGQTPRRLEEAQKKCRHLMPNGGRPPKAKPEEIAQQRAHSKCMRDNGVTQFPDPDSDGGIRIQAGEGTGINPDGEVFRKADRACRKFAPGSADEPSAGSRKDGN